MYNDSNSYYDSVFIAEGTTSGGYSIAVPTNPTSDWTAGYGCYSVGCSLYVDRGYFAVAGTTWNPEDATLLSKGIDHSGIDLTILRGNQIYGLVSLPGVDVAPPGDYPLQITARDTISYWSTHKTLVIPEGMSSIGYVITVPTVPTALWRVTYGCYDLSDCGPYLFLGFYSSTGTTYESSEATLLAGGAHHTEIDLTLIPGNWIKGYVVLPPGDVAPPGGLSVHSRVSDTIDSYTMNVNEIIPEGGAFAPYALSVPFDSAYDWRVSYGCTSVGCEAYLITGYYSELGTTPDSGETTLLAAGEDHNNIHLTILKDLPDSCDFADEVIGGPVNYADDYFCSAENSITAGDELGVIIASGGYVVYSAPVIELLPGFSVTEGIFRAGARIYP